MLGVVDFGENSKPMKEWRSAAKCLVQAGHMRRLDDLYDPNAGASIYLIHGLKIPFVVHYDLGMHDVNGLMSGRDRYSDQESIIHLK